MVTQLESNGCRALLSPTCTRVAAGSGLNYQRPTAPTIPAQQIQPQISDAARALLPGGASRDSVRDGNVADWRGTCIDFDAGLLIGWNEQGRFKGGNPG